MRRRPVVALSVGILVVIIGGWFLFEEFSQGFPSMSPGFYVGFLDNGGKDTSMPWAVQVSPEGSDVFVAVGDAQFPAQRAAVTEKVGGTRLPLVVGGAEHRLRITGREVKAGSFEGAYSDSLTSERGTWHLKAAVIKPIDEAHKNDLRSWAATWKALTSVERKVEEARATFDGDSALLEGVKHAPETEGALKGSHDREESSPRASLDGLQKDIAEKKTELKTLLNAIQGAQRVSPEGRLVAMSRESVQREGQWIEKVLRLTAPEIAEDFEASYERARTVKALQDQIAEEQRLVQQRSEVPLSRERGSEADREEEFYNGLR